MGNHSLVFTGKSCFQGFLGGAGFQSSTSTLLPAWEVDLQGPAARSASEPSARRGASLGEVLQAVGIGVLAGCCRKIAGDPWWFNHLPGKSISPNRTPMALGLRETGSLSLRTSKTESCCRTNSSKCVSCYLLLFFFCVC